MPELIWDPLDVFTVLETEPEIEEYETCFHYRVRRENAHFDLQIFPFENLVQFDWLAPATLNLSLTLCVRGKIERRFESPTSEYLVFEDIVVVPHWSPYFEPAQPDRRTYGPFPQMGATLAIKPQPRLDFFGM